MKYPRILLFVMAFAAASCSTLFAAEVADESFGFVVYLSDDFQRSPDVMDANTIYQFTDGEATADDPVTTVQIQRLRDTIDPAIRIQKSDLADTPGVTSETSTMQWQSVTADIVRETIQFEGETPKVAYSVSYPISGESIRLRVMGPMSRDPSIRITFDKLSNAFRATKPLVEPGSGSTSLTKSETVASPINGNVLRAGAIGFGSLLGLAVLGMLAKVIMARTQGPTRLFQQ